MGVFRVGLLVFVTVALVLGDNLARAENLEAGKSAQKLFASNCSTCHSDPRKLSDRIDNWALTEFLQEHYTASPTAAYELATYLIAVSGHKPPWKAKTHRQGGCPPAVLGASNGLARGASARECAFPISAGGGFPGITPRPDRHHLPRHGLVWPLAPTAGRMGTASSLPPLDSSLHIP
jgi:hypothetical protein